MRYRAKVLRIVDGDTIDLDIDLGFDVHKRVRIRLAGVDTNETYGVPHHSAEYQKGIQQTAFVHRLLTEGSEIIFVSHDKTGKYGRAIGDIEVDGKLLSESILKEFEYLEEGYGERW